MMICVFPMVAVSVCRDSYVITQLCQSSLGAGLHISNLSGTRKCLSRGLSQSGAQQSLTACLCLPRLYNKIKIN